MSVPILLFPVLLGSLIGLISLLNWNVPFYPSFFIGLSVGILLAFGERACRGSF